MITPCEFPNLRIAVFIADPRAIDVITVTLHASARKRYEAPPRQLAKNLCCLDPGFKLLNISRHIAFYGAFGGVIST
jgi:hypothetical protein